MRLDNKDCTLLQQTIDLFEDMRPRGICAGISGAPVVIFTDGAHEEDDCLTTHGAVLIDPSSGLHLFFGEEIPQSFVNKWRASGRQRLVGQAEVLPVLVAKVAWAKRLKHRKVLWFIDKDSAKCRARFRLFSCARHLRNTVCKRSSACSPRGHALVYSSAFQDEL